jgi:F-type H+-transporting ATPase subunit b
VELSWPTFILEVVNFLVLVWILKRFLYKPILNAIAQRKATIDKSVADATAKEARAQALAEQYQSRLRDWEQEKEKLRAVLGEEISAQRAQLMAALETSLKQEREKARVLEERRLDDLRKKVEADAISAGLGFTARLLGRAANRDLEATLITITLEDLSRLSVEQLSALGAASRNGAVHAKVASAFSLSGDQRDLIVDRLQQAIDHNIAIEFLEDPNLLAGLRITLGSWVLRANLEDELDFFAEALRHVA